MGLLIDLRGRRVLAMVFAALVALSGPAYAQAQQPPPTVDLVADLCQSFTPGTTDSTTQLPCPFAMVTADPSMFAGLLVGQGALTTPDPLYDEEPVGPPDPDAPSLDPRTDIVSFAMTVVPPADDRTFESAMAALPGAVGTPRTDSAGSIVQGLQFASVGPLLPNVYLIGAARSTVPADFSGIDPESPPAGVTATKLVSIDPVTGQLQAAPGVIAAPIGDSGLLLGFSPAMVDLLSSYVATVARTPPPNPATPAPAPVTGSTDGAFGNVLNVIGGDTAYGTLYSAEPGEAVLANFLLSSCVPPVKPIAVQPDGKPPVAGHPIPAIKATCAVTTAPAPPVLPGSGPATPISPCSVDAPPLPAGEFVFCGGKPMPSGTPRTVIMLTFDQPVDLLNGSNGVYGAPILDINPSGNPSNGFKARKGFTFDSLQGSKSYLKVVADFNGHTSTLKLQSIAPGKYAPKPTAGFVVFAPWGVVWEIPGSPTAAFLPLVEWTTLTGKTSFETVVTPGSLGGVPADSGPARLLSMYFQPIVIPRTLGDTGQ